MKNLLTKTAPIEPTLGERYGEALAISSSAGSVFQGVLNDLMQAEAHLHAIAADAQSEIDRATDEHTAELLRLENEYRAKVADLGDIRDMANDDAERLALRAQQVAPLVA